MYIRKAEKKDIQALLDIYNYEVVNGVATLDLEPKTYAEWQAWFAASTLAGRKADMHMKDIL